MDTALENYQPQRPPQPPTGQRRPVNPRMTGDLANSLIANRPDFATTIVFLQQLPPLWFIFATTRALAVAAMNAGEMSMLEQAAAQLIGLRPASPDSRCQNGT